MYKSYASLSRLYLPKGLDAETKNELNTESIL